MDKVWFEAVSNIKKILTPQNFGTWIKPIKFAGQNNDNAILLEVPNKFFKDWLTEHYLDLLSEALASLAQQPLAIELVISQSQNKSAPEHDQTASTTTDVAKTVSPSREITSTLNPNYTFDNFVCGTSNQFAHAASQAVASNPATNYNPLFIYGGVGLGKTHLLTAIGNHIYGDKPTCRICYYSAEKFMNEMINCLRYNKMEQFHAKFRSLDVLLIDDVQFMAGKERTQEEFFHTFNSLYESHKQIVVTSDKFPKDIPDLEERLRSRFEWGLIADIQPPDMETKVAILKKKAEMKSIDLPNDVYLFLASSVTTNIRELEGLLIRLTAYASLSGKEITLSMAKDVLKDIIVDKSREISVETIQKQVADHFAIKLSDLKSEKRLKTLVYPRQIAMYLCRELTKASYPEIGEKFGGKDHSTIIHSVKKIEKLLTQDNSLAATMDTVKKGLLT